MNENIAIWNNVATLYDEHRPHAPEVIADLFTRLIHEERPRLVVDLGCGTGLSTFLWAGRAQQVIGIEPNDNMRRLAEARKEALAASNVQIRSGVSTQTGLLAESADIVTCSQCLHWMDPGPTFAEIARILRPGGLFAAYDYAWPPLVDWEVEGAYNTFMVQVEQLRTEHKVGMNTQFRSKEGHLSRIQASGRFRFVKEIAFHHSEMGNAERFIGLALSNGVANYIGLGLREEETGLDRFKAFVQEKLGDELVPWYFSYQARIGVK